MKYNIYMNVTYACWSSIINKYETNLPIWESLPLWKTSKESWTSKGRWQNSWAHFLLETNNILREREREREREYKYGKDDI